MNRLAVVITIAALVVVRPGSAVAQPDPDGFELGVQIVSAISSQFDEADVGLGGRFSWHPAGLVGIEAEINLSPGGFPDQRPFSRGRMEALFGVTVGARFDRVRPFAKAFPTARQLSSRDWYAVIPPPRLTSARAHSARSSASGGQVLMGRWRMH